MVSHGDAVSEVWALTRAGGTGRGRSGTDAPGRRPLGVATGAEGLVWPYHLALLAEVYEIRGSNRRGAHECWLRRSQTRGRKLGSVAMRQSWHRLQGELLPEAGHRGRRIKPKSASARPSKIAYPPGGEVARAARRHEPGPVYGSGRGKRVEAHGAIRRRCAG